MRPPMLRVHTEDELIVDSPVERVTLLRGELPKEAIYGFGDGSGFGFGSGDGDGSGDGSGDGDGYWLATIPGLIAGWTGEMRDRVDAAKVAGATLAFWRSHEDGRPANGGRGGPRAAGDVEKIPGPLRLCGGGALHATLEPGKWQGARVWLVALYGEVIATEDKLGALHREILGEAWCAS